MQILVSGLLAYDRIMDFPGKFSDQILPHKIHTLNVSFVTHTLSEHFGGTAGNIAYNLALLGEKSAVLSAAGKDFEPYRAHLERAGADLQFVRAVPDKHTSFVTLMTDKSNNQIASVYLGTMAHRCALDAKKIQKNAFAIVAPGNVEDMCQLPGIYKSRGVRYIFDPGQQIPLLSKLQLQAGITGSLATICNDYELSFITARTGWNENDILKKTNMLIVTLGEKGSLIRVPDRTCKIPAAKLKKEVDPTGAGDAYRAGLIKGLLSSWPLDVAGRFAGVIAAYAIESYGAQGHRFTLDEAKKRYRQNFGNGL